jgi:hypothetical protein
MKRSIFAAVMILLTLVFIRPIPAQTTDKAEKSLKTLKKSLSKNSRYGDEVIYWFNPVDFNRCQVSYRFARLNENGAERFATVVADRSSTLMRNNTISARDLPEKPSAAQQNSAQSPTTGESQLSQARARAKVFYNNSFPYYYYGVDRRTFFLEQVVTVIDLALIDPSSIKLQTAPAGQEYVVFKSLKDKSAIEKRLLGSSAEIVEVESDFVPVNGEKGGAKITAAFVEAVNACRQ